MIYFKYTELKDKSVCMKEDRINFEKLKGRYKV